MNIVFVSSEYPQTKNNSTGGIGTYLLNLTTGLINKGDKVVVITKETGEKYQHNNVQIITCSTSFNLLAVFKKILPFKFFIRIFTFLEYPILFSIEVFFKLKALEKKIKIDIIEGNDFGGELFFYLLLKSKRPPVVLRLHTPSFVIQKYNNEHSNLYYKIMKFLEVNSLKKADSLYSPSRSLARIISLEINRQVSAIIPYPFKPAYYLKGIKKENNTVLYVGKLQSKKGVFKLAKAIPLILKSLPEAKFVFSGQDTLWRGESVKQKLIDFFQKKGISKKVQFSGVLDKRDLYTLYKKSTITVIPSLWENFPNVCLEAMANDSFVIANNVGGLSEIIENNSNGVLIDILKHTTIASKIIYYLKNDNLRIKVSDKARKEVREKYSLTITTKATVLYYHLILRKNYYVDFIHNKFV